MISHVVPFCLTPCWCGLTSDSCCLVGCTLWTGKKIIMDSSAWIFTVKSWLKPTKYINNHRIFSSRIFKFFSHHREHSSSLSWSYDSILGYSCSVACTVWMSHFLVKAGESGIAPLNHYPQAWSIGTIMTCMHMTELASAPWTWQTDRQLRQHKHTLLVACRWLEMQFLAYIHPRQP